HAQHFGRRGLLFERFARLGHEPSVFHGDDSLGGEVLQEGNLLMSERTHFSAIDPDKPEQSVVLPELHGDVATDTADALQDLHLRRAGELGSCIMSAVWIIFSPRSSRSATLPGGGLKSVPPRASINSTEVAAWRARPPDQRARCRECDQ